MDQTRNSMQMIDNLTTIISQHLGVGQETKIKTASIEVNYKRTNASELNNQLDVDGNEIKMPSVCDILKDSDDPNCERKIVTQQVKHTISYTTLFNSSL